MRKADDEPVDHTEHVPNLRLPEQLVALRRAVKIFMAATLLLVCKIGHTEADPQLGKPRIVIPNRPQQDQLPQPFGALDELV